MKREEPPAWRSLLAMAGTWKTLLISPNKKLIGELKPLLVQQLPTAQVSELGSYPPKASVGEVMTMHRPNLCFLDMMSDQDRAMSLIPEILAVDSNLSIVALLPANDPDFILRVLRRGALEFIQQPFSAEQLQPVVERVAKQANSAGGGSDAKIYCVMPAKGACGASTIAFNLSYQLRKADSSRVLLADLDPLTGTAAFHLKLKATYSYLDVLSHSHHLDSDLWKSMISTVQGVDVLLSPEHLVQGITDLRDASPILTFARGAYDTITLDTNGVYGEWSLALARLSDEVLLVTTNELPALQATQRALSYLDQNRIDRSKIKLVVNRFNKEVGLSEEVIGTALNMNVFHAAPSDYESVNRALLDGKAIPPTATFGKSMQQLATRLRGGKVGPAMVPPAKKSGGLSGLFARFGR